MRRRVLIVILLALAGVAIVQAADPGPTPQGMTMSHEKLVPLAPGREKPAVVARATDKVWSGLVYATNATEPKDPPPELREFGARLMRVFGYNQFELMGSASKPIDADGESWLVPSKNFWLSVRARPTLSKEARGGYLLNLLLFHDERPIVDTEAKLAPGSPLFIRGPACGKGHLIIVLQVQR
jgi:hypothetical protein